MPFKILRKSKGIFLLIIILLIFAVAAFLFFKFKPTKEKLQELNAYTKEVITKYASDLVSNLVDAPDPFNLDSSAKDKISEIISALETQDKVIIFNGQVFSDLEVVEDLGVYYLKPVGFESYNYEDYLEIVKKEDIDPQEFYDAIDDPVQREVVKMFYEDLTYGEEATHEHQELPQEPSSEEKGEYLDFISDVKDVLGLEEETAPQTVKAAPRIDDLETRLNSFLDSKIDDGTLSNYGYSSKHDSLTLTYGGEEIPWLLNPSLYAQAIDYVITAYSDPSEFSKNTLDEYSQKLDRGDVLIVNTMTIPVFYDFFNRQILKDNLKALIDDSISKDEKIEKVSGGIFYIDPDEPLFEKISQVYSVFNADIAWADNSQGDITQLLNREGVITPPSKDIYIIRMADSILSKEIKRLKGKSDRDIDYMKAAFYPYIKNGYNLRVLTYRWADHTIEKFAEILSNQKISVTVLDTHGAYLKEKYYLYGELYDRDTDDSKITFDKRLERLQNKPYGSGVMGVWKEIALSPSEKYLLFNHDPGLAGAIKNYLIRINTEKRHFGIVGISKDFFKHFFNEGSFYKKSVFILYVCYSWELSDIINTRVFIAPSKGTMATREHFIESDLTKLAPYLLKKEDPGPVEITSENMRNYDILKSFRQKQLLDKEFQRDKLKAWGYTCVNQKDRLCNAKLLSPPNETVSVSPHVQYAGPDRIEFNVPMEDVREFPAEQVVTLDYSQCKISQKVLANLEPKWSGDKEIILSWKDKIYRDWQPSDDPTNIAVAKITVHNNMAVSKISKINLTGNSDCCATDGCKVEKCWRTPHTIKYNGNHPKTDFVYFMPCIDIEGYYEACRDGVVPQYIKIAPKNRLYPKWIKVGGSCYRLTNQKKKEAKLINIWGEAEECREDCQGHYGYFYRFCPELFGKKIIKVRSRPSGEQGPWWFDPSPDHRPVNQYAILDDECYHEFVLGDEFAKKWNITEKDLESAEEISRERLTLGDCSFREGKGVYVYADHIESCQGICASKDTCDEPFISYGPDRCVMYHEADPNIVRNECSAQHKCHCYPDYKRDPCIDQYRECVYACGDRYPIEKESCPCQKGCVSKFEACCSSLKK